MQYNYVHDKLKSSNLVLLFSIMFQAIIEDSTNYDICTLNIGNIYDNPLRRKLLKYLKANVDIRESSFDNVMGYALFYDSLKATIKNISFVSYNNNHPKIKEDPELVFQNFEDNKYLDSKNSLGIKKLIADYLTDLEIYNIINEEDRSIIIDFIRIRCRFDPNLRIDGFRLLESLMERFICYRSNSIDVEFEFSNIRIGDNYHIFDVNAVRLIITTLKTISIFCEDQSQFDLDTAGRKLAAQTDENTLNDMISTLDLNRNININDTKLTTDNYSNNFTSTESFLEEVDRYISIKKDVHGIIKDLILDQSYILERKDLSTNDNTNYSTHEF